MKIKRFTWSKEDITGMSLSDIICTGCIYNKVKCLYLDKEPDHKQIRDIVVNGVCEYKKAAK